MSAKGQENREGQAEKGPIQLEYVEGQNEVAHKIKKKELMEDPWHQQLQVLVRVNHRQQQSLHSEVGEFDF